MRTWLLVVGMFGLGCTGSTGPAGPQGPAGSDGTNGSNAGVVASINGVTPAAGYLARTYDVVVSGDNTTFDATTTVSFGAGITVSATRLVSPTELVCTIAIAETAAGGNRDVTVTTGATTLTATTAFAVAPSLGIVVAGGPVLQGDILTMTVTNLTDEPLALPNELDGTALLAFENQTASGQYFTIVDVDEPAGPTPFKVTTDLSAAVYASDGTAFEVGARTPTPLTLPYSGAVVFDTRSKAFSIATSSLGIVSVSASSIGSSASRNTVLTEGGANFDDYGTIDSGLAVVTRATAKTTNLIIGGGSSTGNDAAHTLTLSAIQTPVASVTAESGSPHPDASPQTVTSPAIVDGATAGEIDAYAISVPGGGTLEVTASAPMAVVFVIADPSGIPIIDYTLGSGTGFSGTKSFHLVNSGATGVYKVELGMASSTYTLSFRTY